MKWKANKRRYIKNAQEQLTYVKAESQKEKQKRQIKQRKILWSSRQDIWHYSIRGEKRMKKAEEHLHGLWDTIKINNLCFIGISEREEREKRGKAHSKK